MPGVNWPFWYFIIHKCDNTLNACKAVTNVISFLSADIKVLCSITDILRKGEHLAFRSQKLIKWPVLS